MKEKVAGAALTVCVASVLAYLQWILPALIVLLVCIIVDYITGMVAAGKDGSLNSSVGWFGILKKLTYAAVVIVGIVCDYLLYTMLSEFNIDLAIPGIIGLVVTIWLIINELLSILENCDAIGVRVPKFLIRLIEKMRDNVPLNESDANHTDGDICENCPVQDSCPQYSANKEECNDYE